MLIAGEILLGLLLLLVGLLLAFSPGKPRPVLDLNGSPIPGSLSEKVRVRINGIEQGMFIRSTDVSHPVLLFLHGGMPEYFLEAQYPSGLEQVFTVVWWDQRGSGLSYSPDIPRDTLTLEQMVADTLAVTDYLRERFGQDKIYLMGHSGGTFIGIHAAAQAPELYHAYIGAAQMAYQLKSELLAYDYMLAQYEVQGNERMVKQLRAAPVTMTGGTPDAYLAVRDAAMHGLGIGTTRDMRSVMTGIFLPSLANREYTLPEKINLWAGKSRSGVGALWPEMLATDLSLKVTHLEVPVYFVHGSHDYTVSYTLARTYFDALSAPVKGFYTLEQSAHSPMFEEPERMLQILRKDVLRGTTSLADAP